MTEQAKLGDRVAFSARHLRSLAEAATSRRWRDRGRVIEETDAASLVVVLWDRGYRSTVNRSNLRCVDRGAGLNEETPASLGNAWDGMGFIRTAKAEGL